MRHGNAPADTRDLLALLCSANSVDGSLGGITTKTGSGEPPTCGGYLDLSDLGGAECPVDERAPEGESVKQGANHSLTRGEAAPQPSHNETIAPYGLPSRFDLSPYVARVKAALADPKWATVMGCDLVPPATSLCKAALGPLVPPVTDMQARLVTPHMGHLKTPTAAALHAINQQKAEAAAEAAKKDKGKDKPPVGLPMTDGAQQAAGFQAGSQPGTGTSVGPGNSPSNHPITSYSGLGTPGTVNGNAAFGTRNNSLSGAAKTGSLNMNMLPRGNSGLVGASLDTAKNTLGHNCSIGNTKAGAGLPISTVLQGSKLHKEAAGPLTAEELAWFQQQPGVKDLLGSLGMEVFEGKLKPQVLKKGNAPGNLLSAQPQAGPGYVRINAADAQGNKLLHHYLTANEWGSPAGRIEEGEEPGMAAIRELLERTGYQAQPEHLTPAGVDGDFHVFNAPLERLTQIGKPQTEVKIGADNAMNFALAPTSRSEENMSLIQALEQEAKQAGIVGDIARHPVTPFVAQPLAGAGISLLLNELMRRGSEAYTDTQVPEKHVKRERLMSLGMGAGMGLARAAAPYAAKAIQENVGAIPALT
jgi:hypothetical protein